MSTRAAFFLLALFAGAALGVAPFAAPVAAKEADPPGLAPPPIEAAAIELLPLSDLETVDFNSKHGALVGRIRALEKRAGGLRRKLAARKKKKDAAGRKMGAALRELETQGLALRTQLTEVLAAAGVDGALIAYMNRAPSGPRRLERYAYGLVLTLEDLDERQRALFERVRAEMEGAVLALRAQKERTSLALGQVKLGNDERRQLLGTFGRQERLIDQRFWQLADYALSVDQRARLWRLLPSKLRRKAQPVEHLYGLSDLSPSQATRLKALVTEVEQESSPDHAAVKRINAALRSKDAPGTDRAALTRERREAYGRLGKWRRYSVRTVREILTPAQWQEYEAIPPRLSTNDRRGNYRRVLEGFAPAPAQAARIRALHKETRAALGEVRRRTQALSRQGEDFGADSPQMAGMQMEMQGMRAQGERAERALLGRLFLEVLTPEQITRWLTGHYGYKK